MTEAIEPITVLIQSRNRPLYLWACLDSLFTYTQRPARFILVDNASDDPAVLEVVRGFERRGMFAAVLPFGDGYVIFYNGNGFGKSGFGWATLGI